MLAKAAGYCAGCGGDVDVNVVVGRVLEGKRLLVGGGYYRGRGRGGDGGKGGREWGFDVAVETGGSDDESLREGTPDAVVAADAALACEAAA
jgi:hypothetical protein